MSQIKLFTIFFTFVCLKSILTQESYTKTPCERTFVNTNVTLVGAKDINTVTGCFEYNDHFKKVTLIQIINETVPVLKKSAISGLPKLVDIILDGDSISELNPGCFSNLPNLYLIKIRYNNFSTVREDVFNHLELRELCLTANNIETVHPKAFHDLPNLKILYLDRNKIAYWSSEWFFNSPNIVELNFKENLITGIPNMAFKNLKGIHNSTLTNVYLENNKIRYISDGAFEGIRQLGWLMLQRNEIEDISEASLGTTLKSIEWLRLEHNHLTCIPEKLVEICKKVVYYLSSNPLTPECKAKFETIKNCKNYSD